MRLYLLDNLLRQIAQGRSADVFLTQADPFGGANQRQR